MSDLRVLAFPPKIEPSVSSGKSLPLPILLGNFHRLFDAIFESIWFRKAFHLLGGGVVVAVIAALDSTPLLVAGCLWLAIFSILSKHISTAALGLIFLFVLSGSKFATLGAAAIFVAGDGMAGLVGSAFGVRKWPWSKHKTIVGSLAFLAAAFVTMEGILRFVTHTAAGSIFVLAFWPSLVGCAVESLPLTLVRDIRDLKPDDNLLIVLSSGAALLVLTRIPLAAWLH